MLFDDRLNGYPNQCSSPWYLERLTQTSCVYALKLEGIITASLDFRCERNRLFVLPKDPDDQAEIFLLWSHSERKDLVAEVEKCSEVAAAAALLLS